MHNLFLNINYDFLSNFRIYLLFKVISNARLEPQLHPTRINITRFTLHVLYSGIVRSLLRHYANTPMQYTAICHGCKTVKMLILDEKL